MNRICKCLVILLLGFLSCLASANSVSDIHKSIVGVWGESHTNGESFWSIYNYMPDGTVHARLSFPYVDSVIQFDGEYEVDGDKICVTVKNSSHQDIMSIGKLHCFDIIEIYDDYIVYKVNDEVGTLLNVNETVELVNEIPIMKANLIEELLNTSGKLDAIENILIGWIHEMIVSFQISNQDIPNYVIQKIETRTISLVKKEMIHSGSLLNAISIIYHKYFTYKEIEQLLKFYNTAAGQKLGGLTNRFAEEISMATKIWSKKLQPAVIDQIQMIIQSESYSFINSDQPRKHDKS